MAATLTDPAQVLRQADVVDAVYQGVFVSFLSAGDVSTQARLRGVSSPGADAWLHVAPSPTRDLLFSNAAFVNACAWE